MTATAVWKTCTGEFGSPIAEMPPRLPYFPTALASVANKLESISGVQPASDL